MGELEMGELEMGEPEFNVEGLNLVRHGCVDPIATFSPEEAHEIGMKLIQAAKDDYDAAMKETLKPRED